MVVSEVAIATLMTASDGNPWAVNTMVMNGTISRPATVSTVVFTVVLPWLVGVYRRQHVALAEAGTLTFQVDDLNKLLVGLIGIGLTFASSRVAKRLGFAT